MNVDEFFRSMWADYVQHCPSASAIHELLGGGQALVNDHIALRSFDTAELGLAAMEPVIESMGYQRAGEYSFEAKHLKAYHYQHSDSSQPKIFISEVILDCFSEHLRQLVAGLLGQMPTIELRPEFLSSGRHWQLTYAQYQDLLRESEYVAWLAAFGFRANHFTVDINALQTFHSVAEVNAALKQAGFSLNAVGGEIKGSPALMLEQSSTLADKVEIEFRDGKQQIPACFYEFAYRYPQADGTLFQGFVESSADKIFQSTDAR